MKRFFEELLMKFNFYSLRHVRSVVEEVSHDFKHVTDIDRFVKDKYKEIHYAVHAELVNAALLSDNECKNDCTCEDCRD